jgi:exopolysaccharide biosynthesis polyprenyl glycosylphosphotransferase
MLATDPAELGLEIRGVHVLDTCSRIQETLVTLNPEEVVVAVDDDTDGSNPNILKACDELGVQARIYPEMHSISNNGMQRDVVCGLEVLTRRTSRRSVLKLMVKRAIDLVVASLMLVIVAPFLAVISVLIFFYDGRPILYRWKIIGHHRKPVTSWKFRTMVKNADQMKQELYEKNEMQGPVFKLKNDPRILPFGRFLRKHSLDELPQLFSVILGDLSLVGPRPPLQTEFIAFKPWQRRKLSVKPGLTCLWQINGRNTISSFDEWVELDLKYIDSWSLWLDIKILLKTIPAVLSGKGAS